MDRSPFFRRTAAAVLVAIPLLLPIPGGAAAQGVPSLPALEARPDPLADAAIDALFFEGRLAEAIERLQLRIERDPADADARWRVARAALNLGMLEPDPGREEEWYAFGGEVGEQAVALRPDDPDGLYWTAAVLGRWALFHGPRTSTRLVQRVWDLTHRLLDVDPDHPGAHNILGKLNHEVMSLSGIERFVGRLLFRIEPLKQANWDSALEHHGRAAAIDPQTVLFRRDLGQTLAALGRFDDARLQWEDALTLPSVYPVDDRFKDRIRGFLDALPPSASGAPGQP